jgi:SAM-dependent methyltransferase
MTDTKNSSAHVQSSSLAAATATAAVAALYERHPYPHYPLLARPRFQEGWMVPSTFAARLLRTRPADGPVLVAGSGEILPWMVRKWEPDSREVVSVDLSARSLARAKIRSALQWGPKRWVQGDILEFLQGPPHAVQKWAHIECWGVLHHMFDPAAALAAMADSLAPRGTLRVMVYNSLPRYWIHAIQDIHTACGLGIRELSTSQKMVRGLCSAHPGLDARLKAMGNGIWTNRTRWADTFLHPLEKRSTPDEWWRWIESAGLVIKAVHDRYGELDDLPNPLWFTPSIEAVMTRAADLRFENNLEMWLTDQETSPLEASNLRVSISATSWLSTPPQRWFDWNETRSIDFPMRFALWSRFLQHLRHPKAGTWSAHELRVSLAAKQRLARIGAILPGQVAHDPGLFAQMAAPMCAAMSPPAWPQAQENSRRKIIEVVRLHAKNLSESKLEDLAQQLSSALGVQGAVS